jgi:hypothetical protein
LTCISVRRSSLQKPTAIKTATKRKRPLAKEWPFCS